MPIQLQKWMTESDGIFSENALVNKLEKEGYSCTCYTCPPGTRFPEHKHDIDKIDAVIKGCFRISSNDRDYTLHPGDRIHIPAGTRHTAEVIGDSAVVAIDAVGAEN